MQAAYFPPILGDIGFLYILWSGRTKRLVITDLQLPYEQCTGLPIYIVEGVARLLAMLASNTEA